MENKTSRVNPLKQHTHSVMLLATTGL